MVITGRQGLVSGGGGRHQHLKRLFSDNELDPEATVKKHFIVQTEGSRQVERAVEHYDALITAETRMHEALKTHKNVLM